MSASFPERPNLDQLRRHAKRLRDAARSGDPAAVQRIGRHLRLRSGATVTLSAAQLVIAREYGFASWPRLKAAVETALMDFAERVTAFLEAGVGGLPDRHRMDRAARLLAAEPGIAAYDFRTAVALGDAPRVRRYLARDPALAVRPDERSGWPPLLSVCGSHWHRIDPARAEGMVEVARLLLEAGAEPNTAVGEPGRHGHCSALYAAAGLANNPPIAALLLERGGDPDTPAALYHTAFLDDHACLRLLLDHGARAEGGETLAAAISVGDIEAVRLLLAAGVDPRRPLPAGALGEMYEGLPPIGPVYAAVGFRCPAELIALLLRHGADVNRPGPDERSAYRLAVRHGDLRVAEMLLGHGAIDDTTDADRFVGACTRGDRATAQRPADDHPGLLDRLSEQDRAVIVEAAAHSPGDAVQLMLDLGFEVNARRPGDGNTALHEAAYAGRAGLVRLLLERGADVDARDALFDATPLAFATVGSGERPRHSPAGDWAATVRLLLDAGAATDGAWVATKPPSDDVAMLLHVYGVDGEPES